MVPLNLKMELELLLNKKEVFSLINAANIQSNLMHNNFVVSRKSFFAFSDKAKGIPLMVPADKKLFYFDTKDVFTLSKSEILKIVYNISDEKYVGYKHAFNELNFLSKFEVKNNYKPFINRVIKQNSKIEAYVASLKEEFKNIGAFQTRNIPHLGHELIIQRLLEVCDHVVINPVIGPKKSGDVTIECLESTYTLLSQTRYKQKISFKPIFANMFYAGPREAIHHALMRQQIGFQHFTIGRDHAGAESVYDPQDAPELIKQNIDRLKIQVMVHNGAAFCLECNKVTLIGDCSHSIKSMVDISGSDFRSSLKERNMFNLADPEMQKYLLQSNIEMFEK
jgi:sulfate adenylyltransferase